MNERIAELRKNRGWTQDEFAERMGISKNYVSLIENGKRIPSPRLVSDICREFGVNENWLKTGNGEKKIKLTYNQEIAEFANDVMELPDKNFKKRLVMALARLDDQGWNALEHLLDVLDLKENDTGEQECQD